MPFPRLFHLRLHIHVHVRFQLPICFFVLLTIIRLGLPRSSRNASGSNIYLPNHHFTFIHLLPFCKGLQHIDRHRNQDYGYSKVTITSFASLSTRAFGKALPIHLPSLWKARSSSQLVMWILSIWNKSPQKSPMLDGTLFFPSSPHWLDV